MRIVKLTLHNFLSYAHEEINLEDGLLVFVGENGSGKTALFQALRFVLGSNQKDERYPRWSDFIRHGCNEAWVEVVLSNGQESITIRRRVVRGRPPQYFVNGKLTTAESVRRIVRELETDPGNPFVFCPQGKIDAIKDLDPIALREAVEEITGLAGHRREILDKLDKIRELSERKKLLEEELRALNSEEMNLRPQIKKLERKRKLEEELKKLEAEELWAEISERERELAERRRKMEELKGKCGDLAHEIERINAMISETRKRIEELEKKKKSLEEVLRKVEGEIAAENMKIEEKRKEYDKIIGKIERLRAEMERLDREKRVLEGCIRNVEKRVTELKHRRARIEQKIEKLHERKREVENKLKDYREWEGEWSKARELYNSERRAFEEKKKEVDAEMDRLRDLHEELAKVNKEIQEIGEEIEHYNEEELRRRMEDLERKRGELIGELGRITKELANLDGEIRELRAKLLSRDKRIPEEVTRLEKEVERRGINAMGPLMKHMEVPDEYAEVVEIIFGGDLLSFVVFDEMDLKILKEIQNDILNDLRRRKYRARGVSIYMPKVERVEEKEELREEGVVGWLEDLITFPEELRPVIRDICGRVVVVRDLDSAIRLSRKYNYRFVTLDGEVVEGRNYVIKMVARREPRGLLSVKRLQAMLEELEDRRKTLEEKRKQLSDDVERYGRELERIRELLNLIPKWRELHERKLRLREEIENAKERVSRLKKELEEYKRRVDEALAGLKEIEGRKPADYDKLIGMLDAIEKGLKRNDIELKKVDRMVERGKNLITELEKMLVGIDTRINEKASVKVELEEELERADADLRKSLKNVELLEGKKKEIKSSIEGVDREISKLKERKEKLREELGRFDERYQDVSRKMETLEEEIRRIEEELGNLYSSVKIMGVERPSKVRSIAEIRARKEVVLQELEELGEVDESVLDRVKQLQESRKEISRRINEVERKISAVSQLMEKLKDKYLEELRKEVDSIIREVNSVLEENNIDIRCSATLDGSFEELGLVMRAKTGDGVERAIKTFSKGQQTIIAIAFICALQRRSHSRIFAYDEPVIFLDIRHSTVAAKILSKNSKGRQVLVFVPDKHADIGLFADKIYGVVLQKDRGVSRIIELEW